MVRELLAGFALACCGCQVVLGIDPDVPILPDASAPAVDASLDTGAAEASAIDASGLDAGIDSAIDSGLDAGIDSAIDSGLDAGIDSGLDAGADAPGDARSSTDGRCGPIVFSVDFDDGGLPWPPTGVSPPGTIAVSDAESSSPPFSMLMSAPANGAFDPWEQVQMNLRAPNAQACLDLDLFIASTLVPQGNPTAGIYAVTFGYNGGDNPTFGFDVGADGGVTECLVYLCHPGQTGGCPVETSCSGGVPTGEWFHVQMDLNVPHDGGPSRLVVRVNGQVVFDGWPDNYSSNLFQLGLSATVDTSGSGLWSMYVDNVVVSEEDPM